MGYSGALSRLRAGIVGHSGVFRGLLWVEYFIQKTLSKKAILGCYM